MSEGHVFRDVDAYFSSVEREFKRSPFVIKVLDFAISEKEGWMVFDGHFYEEDEALPLKYNMFLWESELTPYKREGTTSHFKKIWEMYGIVEIFRREFCEFTEEGGEEKKVHAQHLFLASRQKIWFRVLKMSPAGSRTYGG